MKTPRFFLACAAISASCFPSASLFAQGTAFTYQGVLSQGGAAVNGSSDLTFTLYNAASGGTAVGVSNVVNDLVMSNGLFAVTLDFGTGAFDGAPRWLQIAVRPGASTGGYTNLAPRTPITATPYAIYAGGVSAAGLVGTLPANALAGVNGGGLIGLNASNLVGTVPNARLSTNVALRAGGNTFEGNQSFSGGELSLAGTSTFEFGAGVAGKQISAGMIGYEAFTPGALDIVGAGNTPIERRVQLWEQVHVGNFDADEKPRLISFGDGEFVSIGENGADDRMELTAGAFVFKNGSVGIGTDSPSAKLDVVGNILASGRVGIGINNPATKLTVSQGAYGIEHTDGTRRLSTYVDESGCYFGTVSTDPLFFYVNDGAATMMVNTNGRVGIGTLNPATTLTVQQSGYGIEHTDGVRRFATYVDAGGCYIGTRSVDPLLFYVNEGGANMMIATNGNVGIGVDPTTRLDVGGTVRATSFMGDGSGLTGIAAASVSGTLGAAQIPNLDAVKITTGTVADARLSANVALRAGGNTFSGQQIITGGNVGIGTTAPGFPLNFANALGDKIALFNNVAGQPSFGFGIQSSLLQIHTADVGSDVAFGYGTSAAMTETMRVKGNGRVGIGTAAPMSSIGYPGGWNGLHTSFPGGSGLNIIQGTFSSRLHLRTDNNLTNVAQDFIIANGANRIDFQWLGAGLGGRPPAMSITTNGWVGIGTDSPTSRLEVAGNATINGRLSLNNSGASTTTMQIKMRPGDENAAVFLDSSGGALVSIQEPTASLSSAFTVFTGTAQKPGGGSWAALSDARAKKNVHNLVGALPRLLALRSVTYEYKDPAAPGAKAGPQNGFIAQEVEPHFPDWVSADAKGLKMLSISGFESLTVAALRELQAEKDAQFKQLEARNTKLQEQNQSLEQRVAALEKFINRLSVTKEGAR